MSVYIYTETSSLLIGWISKSILCQVDVFTFDWMDLEKYLVSGDLHEMQNIFVRIYFICDCNDVEVVLLRYRVLVINGWYYL
jgi:hypothetical protein